MERRALGAGDVPNGNAGEEIRLALESRRASAFRQIGDGGGTAEVVGKGHDGAAMESAEPIIELLAYRQFGNHLVL